MGMEVVVSRRQSKAEPRGKPKRIRRRDKRRPLHQPRKIQRPEQVEPQPR
jgi:hypothetical protein